MKILYFLLPLSFLLLVAVAIGFIWAVRSKQFDDLDKEGFSILFNEKPASSAKSDDQQPPQSRES